MRKSSAVNWLSLVVTAIPLVACDSPDELCSGAGGSKEERSQQAAHLSAATAVVGEDPNHERRYTCSGVLVGPTTVLTAAHCVHGRLDWTFHAHFVDDLAFGRSESDPIVVSRVDVHPSFDSSGKGQFDLAVLTLATRAPGNPLPWTTDSLNPAANSRFTFVGYGGQDGDVTKCLRVKNEVTDVDLRRDPIYAFVHPDIYFGDSGGPLLVDLGSGPVVLGVLAQSYFIGSRVTRGKLVFFAKLRDETWLRTVMPSDPVRLGTAKP